MRRRLALAAAVAAVLVLVVPGVRATPAATQENVRLVTTVPGATGGHAVVEGDRLYVGAYGLGMRIFDISDPEDPQQVGEYFPGPQSAGDPGLRADAVPDATVMDGREIATLNGTGRTGGTQQTEFLDVTDPADPELLWRFTGAADGEAHNGDMVDGRGLWLPSGGNQADGLRIYDLEPLLADPPQAPEILFRGDPVTLWQDSPYRVNTDKEVGTPSAGSHHTHDIEVYTDMRVLLPEWEWEEDPDTGAQVPTFADKDIALMAWSTGYALGGPGANTHSVFIVDITDPTDPVVINRWQNPPQNTNNIRYLHEVQFLDGDFSTMVVTDEDLHSGCDSGRLYTVGVSEDLMEATKLAEWAVGSGQADTPLCMGSHVFSSNDRHVFMGAYTAGLQVLDLTDPANPVRAGRYIAEGADSWGALYHDGYVYVGDFGPRGLDVFEFIPDAVVEGLVKTSNPVTRTAVGIAETGCRHLGNPHGPTDGVDGLIVTIPDDKKDGTSIIRATGSAEVDYILDIWFHDADCNNLGTGGLTSDDGDEMGPIPAGAVYASVDLFQGGPTYVYVQIDP